MMYYTNPQQHIKSLNSELKKLKKEHSSITKRCNKLENTNRSLYTEINRLKQEALEETKKKHDLQVQNFWMRKGKKF